jgi:ribosomal protein L7Ae-like RNA K-turn-binding protein
VQDQVRQGRARFVVVAGDLSETGRAKLIPLLEGRGVPYAVRYDRGRLGQAVGKGPLAAVAVVQADFAGRLDVMLGNE